MMDLLKRLHPMHRTLNSDDTEEGLNILCRHIGEPARTVRYPVGSEAFTWILPERFHVDKATLLCNGRTIADFALNPLHLVSYSQPVNKKLTWEEVAPHLFTAPRQPDALPWEFKYYDRSWGFCLSLRVYDALPRDGEYEAVIQSRFGNEDFCIAECVVDGQSEEEILFVTNICHPYQVNDSISGLVAAADIAREMAGGYAGHFTIRFLFVPENVGSLAWLSANAGRLHRIRHALFCEMLGHDNSLVIQSSRQEDAEIDTVARTTASGFTNHGQVRFGKFREVVGNDELALNGPGIDIPTISITRSANAEHGHFPEYHTSADCPDIIREENLQEGRNFIAAILGNLDRNFYPKRTFMGPPFLSRYGLWVDWRENLALNEKQEKLTFLLEGDLRVSDIAQRCSLPFSDTYDFISKMEAAGLVTLHRSPA